MPNRRPRPTWIAATSLVVLVLGVEVSAYAQSAEAEATFTDGDNLMKQGKLAEACDAFAASNKLEARAGTLIRLGECREKNHELASAWSAYRDALTRAKDPKKKKIATEKAAELEKKLSHLTVNVPDGSRLDGLQIARNGEALDAALWNRTLPINGGEYTIVVHAPKHADWQKTVTVPEASGKITVDVPKLDDSTKATPPSVKPPPVTPPPVTPPVVKPVPVAPPPDQPEPHDTMSMWTGKRKIAVGLAGVAVAGVVVGAVLGSTATGKKNNAFALCPDPQTPCADAANANGYIHDGQSLALEANIGFAIAGIAAIGAGVLWFTGAPEHDHGVAIVPSASGIAVVGAF